MIQAGNYYMVRRWTRRWGSMKKQRTGTMKRGVVVFWACLWVVCAGVSVYAQPYVYPNKGQSAEQQNKDQMECGQWAVNQSGVDPYALAKEGQPATESGPKRPALRGAARGAALGVVGGAIAGDAGKGAAIGAGVGAVGGTMRSRDQAREKEQTQQSADANRQQQMQSYDRAFEACMQGRGYSIK